MDISVNTVLAYVIGIIFLFIIGRVFLIPLKVFMKLVYNTIIGVIVLLIINKVGGLFHFQIAINFFSAFITGVLGVPGVILLIVLKFLFK